jgi:hypothetical protein
MRRGVVLLDGTWGSDVRVCGCGRGTDWGVLVPSLLAGCGPRRGELMARVEVEGAPPGYGELGPAGREKQQPLSFTIVSMEMWQCSSQKLQRWTGIGR